MVWTQERHIPWWKLMVRVSGVPRRTVLKVRVKICRWYLYRITPLSDSEDDFCKGCLNVCHHKTTVLLRTTFIRTISFHQLKWLWNDFFYYLIWNSFKNDKEWRLFYCDSTIGCRVIQDFDLCKLDDLWGHSVDTKWCKLTKYEISV